MRQGAPRPAGSTWIGLACALSGLLMFTAALVSYPPWDETTATANAVPISQTVVPGSPEAQTATAIAIATAAPASTGAAEPTNVPGSTTVPAATAAPAATRAGTSGQSHVVTVEDSLAFDDQEPDTTSSAKTVNVSNEGAVEQSLGKPAISGENADAFAIATGTCWSTLAAGAGCSVDVTFAPPQEGNFSASLDIPDGDGNILASVKLVGTGKLSKPNVSVSPSTLTFDENTSSGEATVTNNGQAAATINASIEGVNSTAFTIANNSCGELAGGATCGIAVSFSPPSMDGGNYDATLQITDENENALGSVYLSGSLPEQAAPTPEDTPDTGGSSGGDSGGDTGGSSGGDSGSYSGGDSGDNSVVHPLVLINPTATRVTH